jgi:hypothetical protein
MDQNNPTPEKLYKMTFESRDGYLYACVEGEIDNLEISTQYWREIAEKCKSEDAKKVLIVEDLPGGATVAEVYQIAAELPKMGFYGIKVAFVDGHLDQLELNKFGEVVALNRGLYGKVFNNVPEAEKWILGG